MNFQQVPLSKHLQSHGKEFSGGKRPKTMVGQGRSLAQRHASSLDEGVTQQQAQAAQERADCCLA